METVSFEHILSKEYNGWTSNFLKLGNAGIMFDWGIDDEADPKVLAAYDNYMSKVDVILLTHATFRHWGALPYLKKKYDFSKINVYLTFPVKKLGITSIYEYIIAQNELKKFDLFTFEDIDEAFSDVNSLNFHQPKTLSANDSSFKIMAINAGYSIGGSIWMIHFNLHKFIYAIDINDKNESITEPFQMGEICDAHFLITNTYIAPSIDGKRKSSHIKPTLSKERLKYQITSTLLQHLNFEVKKSQQSDQSLMSREFNNSEVDRLPINDVLINYGLVGANNDTDKNEYPCAGQYDAEILICWDNFSRVLEVLLFLEDMADQNTDLQKIPILYLENMSKESLDIARSHIEWLNNKVKTTFVYIDTNPLNFKSIKVLSKEEELQNYQNPRIIVTSSSSLLLGHSRNLLPKVLSNKKSKLIFINKQLSHPLSTQLIKQDTKTLSHKRISINKVPKKVVIDDNLNSQTNLQSPKDMDVDEDKDKEELITPCEDIEMKQDIPFDEFEVKKEVQIEEIIDRAEVNEIDHEVWLKKHFALSDYPMFAFPNDFHAKNNQLFIDCYGVYTSNEQENEDMYLDELQNKLNRGDIYIDKENDEEIVGGSKFGKQDGKDDIIFGLSFNYDSDPDDKRSMYQSIIDYYKNIDMFYSYFDEQILIECQIAYIPFEGRIDKKSFQIILSETRPKNLIIVNSSPKKVDRIKDFVAENKLKIDVFYLKESPINFEITKESELIYVEPILMQSNPVLKLNSIFDLSKFVWFKILKKRDQKTRNHKSFKTISLESVEYLESWNLKTIMSDTMNINWKRPTFYSM